MKGHALFLLFTLSDHPEFFFVDFFLPVLNFPKNILALHFKVLFMMIFV